MKVLDFGLAKAFQPEASDPGVSASPTLSLTAAATQMGMVIGTAAYMSPEQAKGAAVDKRADVWAFGCVLFEMLTGRRVFDARDVSEVLASVLLKDPDLASLPMDVPPSVRSLLGRCLVKEPRDRLRDVGEARVALRDAGAVPRSPDATSSLAPSTEAPVTAMRLQLWRQPAAILGLVVTAALVGGLSVWSLGPEVPRPISRLTLLAPGLPTSGLSTPLALSPDGRTAVYVSTQDGTRQLYQRPLDQLDATPIRGTEQAVAPFFSPDGEWVAFWTFPPEATLKKVSLAGGPPVTLAPIPVFRWADWGPDGTIVFANRDGLWLVADSGGEPRQIAPVDERAQGYHDPRFTPDGRAVLYSVLADDGVHVEVRLLETGEQRVLLDGTTARVTATGHLLFTRADSLWAAPFDVDRLELTGEPSPVLEGVQVNNQQIGKFALGGDGSLAYVGGEASRASRTLVWVDRDGREESLGGSWPPDDYLFPRLSPDGTRVAVAIQETTGENTDLWVLDLARGSRTRITRGGNNRFYPIWTRDGTQVTFADGSGDTNRLLMTAADGSGQTDTLLDRSERQFPTSWAPDGRTLAFYVSHPDTGRDIWMLPLEGDPTPAPFLATPFEELAPTFSPDGRWIAYVSDESGQREVYVRPYPDPGQQHTISVRGGEEPVWSPTGNELYYRNGDDMMVVAVDTSESFRAAAPQELFQGAYELADGFGRVPNFDITPGGERFLMVTGAGQAGTPGAEPQITIVLNWLEELKERVPVP